MTYTVYAVGGRYRAVSMFPGTYRVTARAAGMQSAPQTITIKAGDAAVVPKLTLTAERPREEGIEVGGEGTNVVGGGQALPYDEVYPPGPERDIAERTCLRCHGANFISTQKWTAEQWTAAIDYMRGRRYNKELVSTDNFELVAGKLSNRAMNDADAKLILPWLVKHYGPDNKRRTVRWEKLQPLDEAALSKAMYVTYQVPKDPPGHGLNDPQWSKAAVAPKVHRPGQMGYVARIGLEDARFAPDGNVWLINRPYPNRLYKLDPRTGAMKDYFLNDPLSGAHDITVDKEGMVWVPEHHGVDARQPKHLTMFNPKTEKWEGNYLLDPDNVLTSPEKYGFGISFDSKQNMFVGWLEGSGLTMWNRQTKKTLTFQTPSPAVHVYGVEVDKSDNVWIAYYVDGKIAKFDTKTLKFTEFQPPTPPGQEPGIIRRLNIDAKNNVWFGVYAVGRRPGMLVKLEQPSNKMTTYNLPYDNGNPYHVASYGDAIWITDAGQGGSLVKFDTKTEKFSAFPTPQSRDQPRIQITKDGAIWFAPRNDTANVLYPDMDAVTSFAAYPPTQFQ